jgi:DNA sulfur modification protein DndB
MTNSTAVDHERKIAGIADDAGVGAFEYVFPAIKGIQAGREFFTSMCPLRLIAKIFLFDEDELVPELRAQRVLNKGRLPELSSYIVDNPDSYVFSALTASIDGEVRFEQSSNMEHGGRIGLLRIPMDARFVINDGQHRRAAIELALRERPELGDESISIVFFVDAGLKRSQQMFADLNRHAIRPSPSIGILYDHRDEDAAIVREMVLTSKVFRDLVEMEHTTLGVRSRKLFTLSGLYTGTRALLHGRCSERGEAVEKTRTFWEGCADAIPDWRAVRDRRASAGELRREYIHSHGIALQALGLAGRQLLEADPAVDIEAELAKLRELDWSRSNTEQWEGRAMVGGRISRSSANVILTANVLMQCLGLPLPPEHAQAESAFLEGSLAA